MELSMSAPNSPETDHPASPAAENARATGDAAANSNTATSRFAFLRRRAVLLATVAVIALGGAGIAFHHTSSAGATAQAAPVPAVAVAVRTVTPQNVRIWTEFSGRMHAVDAAAIRPEVSGRIVEVRVRDGQTVNAGDVLFVIDPRSYEAAVAKAEANLATAQTNAGLAKIEADRAARLVQSQAVSQSTLDQRASAERAARAAIKAAEADLSQARLDLEHAYVKAPIGGRIGRAEITVGNLVQAGPNAPVLTSIVSNDGIYADFEVDEQTYIRSIRSHASTEDQEHRIPVELTAQGDTATVYKGTIHSFDNAIDVGSGTIRARAKFANADRSLVPGMFVSVRLASSADTTALLVPSRAVASNQSKRFVYVVGDDNKVAYREVSLGQQVEGGQRIVLTGLQAGDRVIVDGVQHVRPDATVQVREAALRDNAVATR
jgi:multidrug efflux system membrane fusion protein